MAGVKHLKNFHTKALCPYFVEKFDNNNNETTRIR
jgi:hypothetical protein